LLERAFAALAGALDRAGAPFMVIGGVAVIAHGVKRLTTDVDAVIQGSAVDIAVLLRTLARSRIEPRIERVESFARENLVLLMRHAETGVELDISLGFTAFEIEALAARQRIRFGTVLAPMATPEDLIIFKALAARPKDVGDATALLVMHRNIDLTRVRRRVSELARLAEAPELIDGLEAVIARAAEVRRARPARTQRVKKAASGRATVVESRRAGKKRTPSKPRKRPR
jgi:hypothetical protein